MIFYDILNDTQSQSGPGMSFCKKRFEDVGEVFGFDTRSIVDHPESNVFPGGVGNFKDDLGASGTVLGGVIQQVDKDLLEFSLVAHYDDFLHCFRMVQHHGVGRFFVRLVTVYLPTRL